MTKAQSRVALVSDRDLAAAFHEAGHIVMAYACGGQLSPVGARIGGQPVANLAPYPAGHCDLEADALVTIAGSIAQAIASPETADFYTDKN